MPVWRDRLGWGVNRLALRTETGIWVPNMLVEPAFGFEGLRALMDLGSLLVNMFSRLNWTWDDDGCMDGWMDGWMDGNGLI